MKNVNFKRISSLPNLLLALRLTVVRDGAEFPKAGEGYLMQVDEYERALRNETIESGFPVVFGDIVIFDSTFSSLMPAIFQIIKEALNEDEENNLQGENFVFWENLFLALTENTLFPNDRLKLCKEICGLIDDFLRGGGYFIHQFIAGDFPKFVICRGMQMREVDRKIASLFRCDSFCFLEPESALLF